MEDQYTNNPINDSENNPADDQADISSGTHNSDGTYHYKYTRQSTEKTESTGQSTSYTGYSDSTYGSREAQASSGTQQSSSYTGYSDSTCNSQHTQSGAQQNSSYTDYGDSAYSSQHTQSGAQQDSSYTGYSDNTYSKTYSQQPGGDGNYSYSYSSAGSSAQGTGTNAGSGAGRTGSGRKNSRRKSTKTKKTHRKVPKVLAVTGFALLFGVVSGITFIGTNLLGEKLLGTGTATGSESTSDSSSDSTVGTTASLTQTSSITVSDVSEVVENVMPAVVSITSLTVEEVQEFFGGTYEQETESAGTGIIISQNDSELLVVTNYHVIEGSDTLTVTFTDESSAEASVKGYDSEYDVAVLAVTLSDISSDTMSTIAIATLGDSTTLKVGETAIAIGNALGYGQSVTTGVISAVDRSVEETDELTGETTESSVKLIQTDAAINPGNSGGPLVNAAGEVIGINSSKLVGESVEGVGYAIPISDVSDLLEELMNQETKTKVDEDDQGAIGISGMTVPTEYSEQLNMPTGVYVSEVIEGGGAEAAGMTKGSIITAIEGVSVDSMDELQEQLEYYAKGDTVTLTIQVPQTNGEYEEQTLEVTLGEKLSN